MFRTFIDVCISGFSVPETITIDQRSRFHNSLFYALYLSANALYLSANRMNTSYHDESNGFISSRTKKFTDDYTN